MAFNFNWSPLTADADFYQRARDLLTQALNKSPKPPIIVDDILVSEFNLGTVPPDLEILEIGDLAEDRFRGIFKMCYSGDAFLTLKTRVQANPLNTYLDSKPLFTSPQPLAAASGLTIPVAISLSEIKLSAFIILVFSKQKGLTLVFRNDPLESLKVSSTFDSIQFVRDYLQRTIEQQLRNLMMEELPAIIHRLSLQFWCTDQAQKGTQTPTADADNQGLDPFASPPADPVDSNGNLLDLNAMSELTLHGGEMQYLFSQKNLLRLAALTDSNRTLSLFTPGIRDVVFRAWSGHGDHSDVTSPAVATPSLAKTYSLTGGASTTYTFSDTGSASHGYMPSRPSLSTLSAGHTPLTASAYRSRPGRKKKTRVVNLRRARSEAGSSDNMSDASDTASVNVPLSEPLIISSIPEESEDGRAVSEDLHPSKVRFTPESSAKERAQEKTSNDHIKSHHLNSKHVKSPLSQIHEAGRETSPVQYAKEKLAMRDSASVTSDTSSVILEQAWIMKMAGEIARRVYDEKQHHAASDEAWEGGDERPPPPAYEAAN
ncbi:mitochondrial distribution and morphology [Cordyceps militaris]|uniref:Mitochondrial distribution and morphology protein 34 n=1 Tax=Cordyceps militaris TaxID=73501 RepID=A0A2H4SLC7_CORMI|nr:mitochondrial distribution and morphology [Cordyceps militaris]